MKRLNSLLLLFFILPAWAADPVAEDPRACAAIDESNRIDQQVADMLSDRATNIGAVVMALAVGQEHLIKRAIRYSLAQWPGEASQIVTEALLDGASTEDIAIQCDCSLPSSTVPQLVASAISGGVSANAMVLRCLTAVPPEDMQTVVEAALANVPRMEVEAVLVTALDGYQQAGLNGREQLVNVLVSGNYMSFAGMPASCVGDCLQPAAETLLDYLGDQYSTAPVGPDQAPLVLADEPPLSES